MASFRRMESMFPFQTIDCLPMKTHILEHPERLSPEDRAAEIATILAHSILRLHTENSDKERQVRLGFSPGKRVHTTPLNAGELP